jgi:tetratricopeptide (TPR) repeat protein
MRLGRIEEGARYHEEALAGAVAAHVAWEVAAYSGELVEVKRELGDDEEALHLALAARDAHRAAGQKAGEIAVTNSIGLILHSLGRFPEAIDAYDDGLRILSDAGMEVRRATFLSHKASACLDAGELDRARHHVREALQVVQQTGLRAAEPTCRRTLADIALASGDIKATLNELRIAIVAARHDGTANVIGLQLRSCAAYFERVSDAATALCCVACADAHRFSAARMLYRYRGQRERLIASLEAAARVSAEAEGAALTLQAGLDLAERSLGTA